MRQFESWMKTRSMSAWITTFQAAIRSSRASATIKRPYYPGRVARVCGTECIRQHSEHRKPRSECGTIRNSYLFVEQHQPDQRRIQPHLQLHPVIWIRHLQSGRVGDSGCKLGRHQLRTHFDQRRRWLVVPRRSRVFSLPRRNEHFHRR